MRSRLTRRDGPFGRGASGGAPATASLRRRFSTYIRHRSTRRSPPSLPLLGSAAAHAARPTRPVRPVCRAHGDLSDPGRGRADVRAAPGGPGARDQATRVHHRRGNMMGFGEPSRAARHVSSRRATAPARRTTTSRAFARATTSSERGSRGWRACNGRSQKAVGRHRRAERISSPSERPAWRARSRRAPTLQQSVGAG